jgi:glycerol-3-phosphate acyltransferase PlsY
MDTAQANFRAHSHAGHSHRRDRVQKSGKRLIVVLVLTGYVGLATMLSGVTLVIVVGIVEPHNSALLSFCALVAGFIIYTHRGNIARMRAGQENRVRRLWLFRSRTA